MMSLNLRRYWIVAWVVSLLAVEVVVVEVELLFSMELSRD